MKFSMKLFQRLNDGLLTELVECWMWRFATGEHSSRSIVYWWLPSCLSLAYQWSINFTDKTMTTGSTSELLTNWLNSHQTLMIKARILNNYGITIMPYQNKDPKTDYIWCRSYTVELPMTKLVRLTLVITNTLVMTKVEWTTRNRLDWWVYYVVQRPKAIRTSQNFWLRSYPNECCEVRNAKWSSASQSRPGCQICVYEIPKFRRHDCVLSMIHAAVPNFSNWRQLSLI